jgi:hypothetical protein
LISLSVRHHLATSRGRFERGDVGVVEDAPAELGVEPTSDCAAFYREFEGPFISPRPVPDLDELVDFGSSIMGSRGYFSDRYELGRNYLPLTSDESEGAFLYDVRTGAVFDFSPAEYDAFRAGRVAPRWGTFGEFLDRYFDM